MYLSSKFLEDFFEKNDEKLMILMTKDLQIHRHLKSYFVEFGFIKRTENGCI